MTNNPKKHIIDSLLREIYGEKTPPDQTDEILRRLEAGDLSLKSDAKLGKTEPDSGPYPSISGEPLRHNLATSHSPNWMVVAASLLLVLGLIGATIKVMQNQKGSQQVAEQKAGEPGISDPRSLPANGEFKKGEFKKGPFRKDPSKQPEGMAKAGSNPDERGAEAKKKSPGPEAEVVPLPQLPQFAASIQPADLTRVTADIDAALGKTWHVNVIEATGTISQSEWTRRLFKKLLGRTPEPGELASLKDYLAGDQVPALENRIKIIDTILSGDSFAREFSNQWADKFMHHLLVGGTPSRDSRGESALRNYLRDRFQNRKPLDEIAAELLTAEGSVDPQAVEFNPAAGFVAASGNQLVEGVSRAFLGTELRCAKCHQDSLNGQTRKDFYGLAAYFRDVRVSRKTGVAVVSDLESKRKTPGLFFDDGKGGKVYAPPRIAGIDTPLQVSDARKSAARQLVRSDRFAKSVVNWVWTEMYGYGLARSGRVSQTVDAPHAKLLQHLAEQLVANRFDYRVVIKWAVLSKSFSNSSEASDDTLTKDIPKYGGVAFFSYAYQQLDHDPVESVERLVAEYGKPEGFGTAGRLSIGVKQTSRGVEIIGDVEKGVLPDGLNIDDEIPDFAKGWGVESRLVSTLDRIAASDALGLDQKIEHLYLVSLKRMPTRAELNRARSLFKQASSGNVRSQSRVLQDIWWAIYPR